MNARDCLPGRETQEEATREQALAGHSAERLQPNLVSMAQYLAAHGELRATHSLLQQLDQIGLCTARRRLKEFA